MRKVEKLLEKVENPSKKTENGKTSKIYKQKNNDKNTVFSTNQHSVDFFSVIK